MISLLSNQNLVGGAGHHQESDLPRKRRSQPSESDFNVLHLDDNTVVDIENFPLFNLDDDMSSLLDQFEEGEWFFFTNPYFFKDSRFLS